MTDPDRTIDSIIDDEPEGFKLFGKDISRIPCYKSSFFNGIAGGAIVGLGNFMMTSNPRKSSNRGFSAYVGITMITWIVCRYRFSQVQFNEAQFKKAIQQRILTEGTELDEAIQDAKSV